MGKIYQNQTKLKIDFDLREDITGATVVIKYVSPQGNTGTLPVIVTDAINGLVSFINDTEPVFTEVGNYRMWAYVVYPDLRELFGEPDCLQIFKEGN